MVNESNTSNKLKEEIQVSTNAKKLLKKLGVVTLNDACQIKIEKLQDLVKGNVKNQVYVDELWDYVHKNGYLLNGEANYLNKLKSVTTNFQDITIADLFMSSSARKFMANYETMPKFINVLKNSTTLLKSFLCFVILYEIDNNLEEIFKCFGNDGLILNMIIADFKHDVKYHGVLMPIFMLVPDKNIYYSLIRNNYWLVSDIVALNEHEVAQIPRFGPTKVNKIVSTLYEKGFKLESKPIKVSLTLGYVKVDRLNLSSKVCKKLEEMKIETLEQLVNLTDFYGFTNEELQEIRQSILKLNLQFWDKVIAMPPKILEKRHNELLEERSALEERLQSVNDEVFGYERMLNLRKETNLKKGVK